MNVDEIQKLGEAIAQNAELLAELDFVEFDPIEADSLPRSIERLKSAKIVDEIEEGHYYPGDHFDLLKKAVRSTNYAENIETDIQEWLARFQQNIVNYYEATQQQDEDNVFLYKRRVYGMVRQINSNLNNSIGQIEEEVNNEFGHLKTIEAKTRETRNYLASTERTLSRLGRLQYKELSELSPNSEVDVIILQLDHLLNQKREYLRSVIQKIQKLNLSFKKIEARTVQLKRIHNAIKTKKVVFDVEQLGIEDKPVFYQAWSEVIGEPHGHFIADNTTSYEESIFKDVARKVRTRSQGMVTHQTTEDIYKLEEDVTEKALDVFEETLQEIKTHLSKEIINSPEAISVVEYWNNNCSLKELITLDAWLNEIYHWSKYLKQDLCESGVELMLDEELTAVSGHSDIHVLSNLSISIKVSHEVEYTAN